jgi:glutathione-specific gamma-glutamylcyclotransferase
MSARPDARRSPGLSLTADLVARCYRAVPRPPETAGRAVFGAADYDRAAQDVLSALGDAPVWVFAYGSLIWKPALPPVEQRLCTASGWHRSFCIEMTRWRGTPDQPGLMMALRSGGSCRGIAQRYESEDRHGVIVRLLEREIGGPSGLEALRIIELSSDDGPLPALCFYADPVETAGAPERTPQEVAWILARACGYAGSGAEYLYNTVVALAQAGIHDPHLWELQELVAREIAHREGQDSRVSIAAPSAERQSSLRSPAEP